MDPDSALQEEQERDADTERQLTAFESLYSAQLLLGLFIFIHLGLLLYLFGWIFTQLKFQNEYTGWVTPPAPGPYIMAAWSHYWFFYPVMLLLLHVLVPVACLFAFNNIYSQIRMDIARLGSLLGFWITIGIFACFIVMWFMKNSPYFPFNPASSDDYCLAYYGSVASSGHCRNVADAIGRPSGSIVLGANEIFKQLFATTGILIVVTFAEIFLVDAIRSYSRGILNAGLIDVQHTNFRRGTRNTPKTLRWMLTLVSLAYLGLIIAYFLTGPLLLDLRHTTQFPATGPVGLHSARTGFTLAGFMCLATIIFMPVLVLLSVRFTGQRGQSQVIIAAMLILLALHCFGMMTVAQARATGNAPGNPNNPSNSKEYCCIPEVFNDPASQCDNSASCPAPDKPTLLNQLESNTPHTTIFAMSFVFIGLDIALITLVYLTTMWNFTVVQNLSAPVIRTVKGADALISSQIPQSQSQAQSTFQKQQQHHQSASPFADVPTLQQRAPVQSMLEEE
jgi:hypothetical protein